MIFSALTFLSCYSLGPNKSTLSALICAGASHDAHATADVSPNLRFFPTIVQHRENGRFPREVSAALEQGGMSKRTKLGKRCFEAEGRHYDQDLKLKTQNLVVQKMGSNADPGPGIMAPLPVVVHLELRRHGNQAPTTAPPYKCCGRFTSVASSTTPAISVLFFGLCSNLQQTSPKLTPFDLFLSLPMKEDEILSRDFSWFLVKSDNGCDCLYVFVVPAPELLGPLIAENRYQSAHSGEPAPELLGPPSSRAAWPARRGSPSLDPNETLLRSIKSRIAEIYGIKYRDSLRQFATVLSKTYTGLVCNAPDWGEHVTRLELQTVPA
ncbi:hypothetical protein ON010_g9714 [Phytophthora cinnamomi]|nr:hypothetical protein ON010_g9714 [Phytophthora cinnamomi]